MKHKTDVATAMILAAGRGERMRPLTDHVPKPLLQVKGRPLIQWHIEALAKQGNRNLVVNTAWLGDALERALGDGSLYRTRIAYSQEGANFADPKNAQALETAGGVIRALPMLADTFWVVAGDVFAPAFVFDQANYAAFAASPMQAHLWLVTNPAHNASGDFGFDAKRGLALNLPKESNQPKWTYGAIGLYKQSFFAQAVTGIPAGNPQAVKAALAPLLRAAMDKACVSATVYAGDWADVGTPERLRELNQ